MNNNEVLIPKMTRLDKTKRKYQVPLLNILVILFGMFIIILSTFINFELKHFIIPLNIFSANKLTSENFVYTFSFIPQIPAVMFVCSTLGNKMSLASIFLYIFLGLIFLPIFALGGGYTYLALHGCGYILAYLPAAIIFGKIVSNKYSLFNLLKATILAVLVIHLMGIGYMLLVSAFKHSGSEFIRGWISVQSGLKIVYDIIVSYILVYIGKYLNTGLNYIMK